MHSRSRGDAVRVGGIRDPRDAVIAAVRRTRHHDDVYDDLHDHLRAGRRHLIDNYDNDNTTTTTTLPSAVTTVPEGCAQPPVAQAVFVGRLASKDQVSAVFEVRQVRAGTLGNDQPGITTTVRYGSDVKFLSVGSLYLVGVAPDPATLALSSSVKDSAELFGGAEVAGSKVKCPRFEAAARTLNIDGTSVNTGVFVGLFSQPWRLMLAFVLPGLFVLVSLFGLVWLRRGTRR